ncbi:unnamed protein product [Prunus armeniaca]
MDHEIPGLWLTPTVQLKLGHRYLICPTCQVSHEKPLLTPHALRHLPAVLLTLQKLGYHSKAP